MKNEVSGTNDPDKRIATEDRKAMKTFIPLVIVAFFVGMGGGVAVLYFKRLLTDNSEFSPAELFHRGQLFLTDYASYLTFLVSILLTVVGILMYRRGKSQIQDMNIDDDDFADQADATMNHVLLIVSFHTVLSWLLFGVSFYGLALKDEFHDIPVLLGLAGFIISLIGTSILQQKVVNFVKELNPEKRGSVFDVKFQSKWMDTCDEAERFYIYKCAFQAYRITQITCITLLVILVMIGMAFPIGILPAMCVCIIWGVLTISYTLAAIKVSASSRPPIE